MLRKVMSVARQKPSSDGAIAPGVRSPGLYVGVAALDKIGRLVLVRRGNTPARGVWAVPMGYVEDSESPQQAAVREAKEETGLDVSIDGVLNEYQEQGFRLIVFYGRVMGGQIAPNDDAIDAELFDLNKVPLNQQGSDLPSNQHWAVRMNKQILRKVLVHFDNFPNKKLEAFKANNGRKADGSLN